MRNASNERPSRSTATGRIGDADAPFDRFERFAKALVNVPKKEIDEQQKKWDTRKDRPKRQTKAG